MVKYLKKIALHVFSLWVVVGSFVMMGITSLSGILLIFVGIPFRRSHRWVARPGMGLCARLTMSRFTLIHDPDFDPERRSVFVQNHVSVLDGHLACMSLPHAFCGLHLHWHFRIPAYGWVMKMASGIPVFPRSSGRTAEITEAAIDRVQNKRISILVFPEGHRTRDGQVQDFKRGVFFMARDAGIPIVPFAIRGFHEVNRAGNWLFHPFKPVEIYLGKQIETVGLSDDEVKELAAQTQKIIADFVERGELPERVTKSLDTNTRAKVAA